MSLERFAETLHAGILSLPQDLKVFLRIVEDPDLDESGKVMACGALLHLLSGTNAIPGVKGTLAFADDAILIRLVIARIEAQNPDVIAHHRGDSPEFFEQFDDDLTSIHDYLQDLSSVLEKTVDSLPRMSFQGHQARACALSPDANEWLYDSVHKAIVEQFEFEEDDVARAVKQAGDIPNYLRQRKA